MTHHEIRKNSGSLLNYDEYATGMIYADEDFIDLTIELDKYQFDLFRPFIGNRILEIGAGTGRITLMVLQRCGFDNLTVIEPSDHFFGILQKRFYSRPDMTIIKAEASDLLQKYTHYFDSVFSVHVMEHIEDDKKFIGDCLKLLKRGGYLIVLVPALQFLYSNFDKNIGHYRRYNKKTIRKLIRGFNVKIERLSYDNFLGIFASLYFFKFRKLDYQSSTGNKQKFFRLYKIYSRFFVPIINILEKYIPIPVGLNLTVILKKL